VGEFNPSPRDQIVIGGLRYEVMPHPAVETFAFGQEGRKAFVFQLAGLDDGRFYALKKFKLAFRVPELLAICDDLAPFAAIPGLEACRRQCLNSRQHGDILAVYPDLEYAVLMPWIGGNTWYDIVVKMTPLTKSRTSTLAWATATVLAALEEAGLAHCDLSSGNVIVDLDRGLAHLIDVEDLYAPGFSPPGALPAGSEGYAHYTAANGLWQPDADRFAGAVLLAEMLAWHDPAIREAAEDEHYFSFSEMQQDSQRYWLMRDVLGRLDGRLVDLFEQAWQSAELSDCPPLRAWAEVIEEQYRQERVAHIVSEFRPIVPSGDVDEPIQTIPAPPEHPIEQTPPPVEPPEIRPAPATPVETVPIQHESNVLPPSPGGPLVGFRPLDLSALGGAGGAATESSHRPIEIPEKTAQQAFEPLEVALPVPEEPATDEGASMPSEAFDALPDGAETTGGEPTKTSEPTKPGPLAALRHLLGKKAPGEAAPKITLPTPQLDLLGVDEDGRPMLAWEKIRGAKLYELQEAEDTAFSEPRATSVRQGTQWEPRESRIGTFFYRVRAAAGESVSEWSNVVRVRITEPSA